MAKINPKQWLKEFKADVEQGRLTNQNNALDGKLHFMLSTACSADSGGTPSTQFYYVMEALEFLIERYNQGLPSISITGLLDAVQSFWLSYEQIGVMVEHESRIPFYKKYLDLSDVSSFKDEIKCHELLITMATKGVNGFNVDRHTASDGRNLLMIVAVEAGLDADVVCFMKGIGADFDMRLEPYGKAVHMLSFMRDIALIEKFNALVDGGCSLTDVGEFKISHDENLLECETASSLLDLMNKYKEAGVVSPVFDQVRHRIAIEENAKSALTSATDHQKPRVRIGL